jgi:hypothetical protein
MEERFSPFGGISLCFFLRVVNPSTLINPAF